MLGVDAGRDQWRTKSGNAHRFITIIRRVRALYLEKQAVANGCIDQLPQFALIKRGQFVHHGFAEFFDANDIF
jgi:hypothetical protein